MHTYKQESGAVSLFVVVFSALLITVVTISFIRIMVRDQEQASTIDLSQSAYDSAQAGVEDAKRALLRYQNICATSDAAACAAARVKLNSDVCNEGLESVVTPVGGEVKVQQNIGDSALNQAYTCVKVQLETPDYLGVLQANSSKVVPLASQQAFDTVQLEWYTSDDLQTAGSSLVDLQSSEPLLSQATWKPNRPSIMRAQMMQFGSGFTLADFDDTNGAGQSDANTLFLYPSSLVGNGQKVFTARDTRKTPTGSPQPVTCVSDLASAVYACSVKLVLPTPIGAGSRNAFLRLSALYNATNYRLTLSDSTLGTSASFDGVQPQIDSTGRANDLFRRVQSRVEVVDTHFPYPDAAVDITGNFCKAFIITDNTADYRSDCTP